MNAEHWECTNEEYHASPGVSNSMVTDYIDDPSLFEAYYVSKRFEKPPPTPDMKFGTDVHRIALPPGSLDEFMVEIPASALNADGHRKGAAWKDFKEEHEGKILCKPDEIRPYREMLANIKDHDQANALINGAGESEYSIRWTDEETDLQLRARLDRLAPPPRRIIGELKTCRSIHPKWFATEIFKRGYHRQAWFYQEAALQLTGHDIPVVIVPARKTPPYSVDAFELDEDFIAMGREEVRSALRRIADSYDTGVWLPPDHGTIRLLSAPRFVQYESEWEITE